MGLRHCGYCGGDHPTSLCPKTYGGSAKRNHLYCSYCGSRRHSMMYCPRTAAGPSNRRRNPGGEFID